MADGILDQWLICGPFCSDRGWATLDEDYLFGEEQVRPLEGQLSFGKPWQPRDISEGMLQFLNAPFAHTLFVTAYAHTYVRAPRDMDALLLCGSDDGIKVWLNGRAVWRNDVNRAAVADEDRAPVRLRAGWNSLLVKVRQGMAHWQFAAQIAAADGSGIPGLESARECPEMAQQKSEHSIGVRPRFRSECWEADGAAWLREVEFEVGNLTGQAMQGVTLAAASASIAVPDIAPGETALVNEKLPVDGALSVMRSAVQARSGGKDVPTRVIVSEPSRLLRDFFAPVFIVGDAAGFAPPAPLPAFDWQPFTSDERGSYRMVDPPGLREYLGGLTGRFPMSAADADEARAVCGRLLEAALEGDAAEFARLLSAAKLPAMGAA